MSETVIRSVPRPSYWITGLFIYPIASFVFTAVIVRPIALWLGAEDNGNLIFSAWLIVTLAVAGWAVGRDYHRLCYELHSDKLVPGRGASAVIIPFFEIRSIVLGLPEKMPWILRIQRFNPKGRTLHRNFVQARKNTILLRLNDQRYLPLNVAYSFLTNGPTLMQKFLQQNESSIVSQDTYTAREIELLSTAQSNTEKNYGEWSGHRPTSHFELLRRHTGSLA